MHAVALILTISNHAIAVFYISKLHAILYKLHNYILSNTAVSTLTFPALLIAFLVAIALFFMAYTYMNCHSHCKYRMIYCMDCCLE